MAHGFPAHLLHKALDRHMAEAITITKTGDPDIVTVGVFDSEYLGQPELGGNVVLSGRDTKVEVTDANTGALTKQHQVTRAKDGKVYNITDLQPDGRGQTVLVLQRAS